MIFFLVAVSARFFALLSIRAALVSGFRWVVSFGISLSLFVSREISTLPKAQKGHRFTMAVALFYSLIDCQTRLTDEIPIR